MQVRFDGYGGSSVLTNFPALLRLGDAIDGFSYADLSEAVGVRKASIHYHFPTKAALSAALMDRYHETIAAHCQDIARSNETAASRLLGLIDLYRAALSDGKTLCLLAMARSELWFMVM